DSVLWNQALALGAGEFNTREPTRGIGDENRRPPPGWAVQAPFFGPLEAIEALETLLNQQERRSSVGLRGEGGIEGAAGDGETGRVETRDTTREPRQHNLEGREAIFGSALPHPPRQIHAPGRPRECRTTSCHRLGEAPERGRPCRRALALRRGAKLARQRAQEDTSGNARATGHTLEPLGELREVAPQIALEWTRSGRALEGVAQGAKGRRTGLALVEAEIARCTLTGNDARETLRRRRHPAVFSA